MINKIGVIGGIGPESSIEYYRLIIKRFQEIEVTTEYPEFIIQSVNMTEMLGYVFDKKLDQLVDFLVERINILQKVGVEYVAIASNTPHIVFEKLSEKVSIPLISIVEETCKNVAAEKIKRVGLLGTKSTMSSGFYNSVAEQHNIQVVIPSVEDQDYIQNKYMSELVFNTILPDTKNKLIEIIKKIKKEDLIEGLILGGTELPLIIKQTDFSDIKIFDTTKIHVESIVAKMTKSI
jgi:aspartate racemase